ncbi:MAG: GspH/FimT family pseudopilin [Nitrospinota bacterium]
MLEKGFTLLELIVVMAIIAIASALALPFMGSSLNELQVKSSSRRVAALFRQTRNDAVTSKRKRIFELDFSSKSFLVTSGSPDSSTSEVQSKKIAGKLEDTISLKGFSYPEEDTLVKEGVFSVSFFPQGNSTGGKLFLGSADYEHAITIIIDSLSGRVRIGDSEENE